VNRGTAIIAGAVVFLAIFFALAGPSWGLAAYRLLQDGGCTLLWLLAAGGIGWLAWRGMRMEEKSGLAFVSCVGLGLGIISLAVLGLGLLGWFDQFSAIAIVAAGDVIGIWRLYAHGKNRDGGQWFKGKVSWGLLWLAGAAVGGVVMLAACFPAGTLWGDEPNGYDVVEYHLQVPREWHELGRMVALRDNVFSYFPFNVEMHYWLAMELHGGWWGPWAGMYLAQMMHVGMCAAAAWAVFSLAGGGTRGIVAAIIVGGTPWVGLLGPVAYDEGGTLLFGTLAIGWALRARSLKEFALAGIFAGFAIGTKLSIGPLMVAAGVVVLARNALPFGSRLNGVFVYVVAMVLAVAPWMVRNWEWSGNPVFPEAMSALGQDHFSAVQAERWREAYWPDKEHRSIDGRAAALWVQVIGDWRYGYVLWPLAVGAIAMGWRNRTIALLGVLLVFQVVFWVGFTHLQSRFMVMAIPIIALMIAQIDGKGWMPLCAVAGVGMSVFSVAALIDKMGKYLEMDHEQAPLIGRENLEGFRMLDTRNLKPGQAVDLIGDAWAFWYQIPMSQLHYKTVFDVDTSDPNTTIDEDWLRGMPKDAVVWRDSEEIKRFAATYYGIKPETRNQNGESTPNDQSPK
jgi:hypothetical protein